MAENDENWQLERRCLFIIDNTPTTNMVFSMVDLDGGLGAVPWFQTALYIKFVMNVRGTYFITSFVSSIRL
jgi:hypothetical protein